MKYGGYSKNSGKAKSVIELPQERRALSYSNVCATPLDERDLCRKIIKINSMDTYAAMKNASDALLQMTGFD